MEVHLMDMDIDVVINTTTKSIFRYKIINCQSIPSTVERLWKCTLAADVREDQPCLDANHSAAGKFSGNVQQSRGPAPTKRHILRRT